MTTFDEATLARFLADDDGQPLVMLNLLRFRHDGGRQRYEENLVAAGPIVGRHGAEIYAGDTDTALAAEPGQSWERVALVRYPSRQAFVNLVRDPDYASADELRIAAVSEVTLQPTRPLGA